MSLLSDPNVKSTLLPHLQEDEKVLRWAHAFRIPAVVNLLGLPITVLAILVWFFLTFPFPLLLGPTFYDEFGVFGSIAGGVIGGLILALPLIPYFVVALATKQYFIVALTDQRLLILRFRGRLDAKELIAYGRRELPTLQVSTGSYTTKLALETQDGKRTIHFPRNSVVPENADRGKAIVAILNQHERK